MLRSMDGRDNAAEVRSAPGCAASVMISCQDGCGDSKHFCRNYSDHPLGSLWEFLRYAGLIPSSEALVITGAQDAIAGADRLSP